MRTNSHTSATLIGIRIAICTKPGPSVPPDPKVSPLRVTNSATETQSAWNSRLPVRRKAMFVVAGMWATVSAANWDAEHERDFYRVPDDG